jgi:hypothetical protein
MKRLIWAWAVLVVLTLGGLVSLYQVLFDVWMTAYPFANPNEWRTRLYIRLTTAVVSGSLWSLLAVWLCRKKPQLKFATDKDIQGLGPELAEFVQHVIPDEEPLFISDEATVWDISFSATEDELIDRCFIYYGVHLRAEELKQPLPRLLRDLNRRRTK